MANWFGNRVSESIKIKKFLDTLSVEQWRRCTSNIDFRNVFDSIVNIGAGSFGEVYMMNVGDLRLVAKEAALTPKETKLAQKQVTGNVVPPLAYPYEYKLFDLIGDLLVNKNSPNFIFPYGLSLCNNCNPFGKRQVRSCYLTFMEAADGDMTKFMGQCSSAKLQRNLMLQILLGVSAMHSKYGILHRDIKLENILLKTAIKPGGFFKYNIKNSLVDYTFYVENMGIVALLSDFGVAVSFLPRCTPDQCGRRNALLVNNGGCLEFIPITCKQEVINMDKGLLGPARPLKWLDGTLSTYNTTRFNVPPEKMSPSIPIDLDDIVRYPPFDFAIDILDVLRMFTGGARMSQPDSHRGIFCTQSSFHGQLALIDSNKTMKRIVYSKCNPEYVVASEMVNLIYREPTGRVHVIEEYNL